jgi:hypothetical protein
LPTAVKQNIISDLSYDDIRDKKYLCKKALPQVNGHGIISGFFSADYFSCKELGHTGSMTNR